MSRVADKIRLLITSARYHAITTSLSLVAPSVLPPPLVPAPAVLLGAALTDILHVN
jgi:hypothetical protein